jgi:hypothetical protein
MCVRGVGCREESSQCETAGVASPAGAFIVGSCCVVLLYQDTGEIVSVAYVAAYQCPLFIFNLSPVCVFVRPESQQVSKQGSSGLTAIAGGVLVMAGGVMVFGGSSGGKVTGPCVGLCVVAGGSRRSGSGSCVGPTGHAVLDGVSHWRGGRRSCPEKK